MARLQFPWPNGYTINPNGKFGSRRHPISGQRKFHHGVDVAMPTGTPITAAADGTVMKIGWSPTGGGHTVLIDHGDIVTVYYHGQHKAKLTVGQRVTAGQFVYGTGSTGASTGPHLHFEVRRRGGKWGDTLNPEDFLPNASERPQEPVREPEPVPELETPVAPVRPSVAVVEPPFLPKPLSPQLKRFFDMQKALKLIPRGR